MYSHFAHVKNFTDDRKISENEWQMATRQIFKNLCTSQHELDSINGKPHTIINSTLFLTIDTNLDGHIDSNELRDSAFFDNVTLGTF